MIKPRIKRIAIVGLGSIGKRHLRLIKELRPELEVILVRSGYGRSWPEEHLSSGSVSSIEEAINIGIDAAIISSPAPFHVKQAIGFLGVGIPLLIEKPLSHNLTNVIDLKELANQFKVPVVMGYVLRHSIDLNSFKRLLTKKAIGQILGATIDCSSYLPDWRPDQDYRTSASAKSELGGGVLLELSHELDYANWLFGPFNTIEATLQNSGTLDIEVEDTAYLTLNANSGFTVSINLDFCKPNISKRGCKIKGSDGQLVWDGIRHIIELEYNNGKKDSRTFFSIERDDMFKAQLVHFLNCVEQNHIPKVTLDDGIAVMTIIEAVRRSNRERTLVYI